MGLAIDRATAPLRRNGSRGKIRYLWSHSYPRVASSRNRLNLGLSSLPTPLNLALQVFGLRRRRRTSSPIRATARMGSLSPSGAGSHRPLPIGQQPDGGPKAASFAAKIPRKWRPVECFAVFGELICVKTRKKPQRILAVLSRLLTTYWRKSAGENRRGFDSRQL